MLEVIYVELENWPTLVQGAVDYLETSTVIIPLLSLMWYMIILYGFL